MVWEQPNCQSRRLVRGGTTILLLSLANTRYLVTSASKPQLFHLEHLESHRRLPPSNCGATSSNFEMASAAVDSLLLLRQCIAAGGEIVPTTSSEFSASADASELSNATHLQFSLPSPLSAPVDSLTRFVTNEKAVDLRSVYFAWLNREVAIPEYNASVAKLNDDLSAGAAQVHQFAFVERLELISWLEGASEESEYIKAPGERDSSTATHAAALRDAPASGARAGRGALDPRLAQIYRGERKTGDRNTVLRGIKPTVAC